MTPTKLLLGQMLIVALIVVAGIWASTQNAYDSVTARIMLIPQDARLIGSYDTWSRAR